MNFQIETHNFCNFTCGYCPNKDMERPRRFMTDEVWGTILNKYVVPYKDMNRSCPPTIILHKDSEPLLDKKLAMKLLGIASTAPDMKIDIYSNGVLLPKWRDRGQDFFEVLNALPNQVRYLMSYHPKNHDYSVNNYEPTIAYLKGVLRNPPPNVEFITVAHRSKWVSEETQQNWVGTWAGLPITVHSNCSINPWTGRIEGEGLAKFSGCPYGDFGHMFFGVTGNVIACCLDLEEEIVFGNVMRDEPAEMVAKLEAFYADQRAGKVQYPVCANCFGQKREDVVQVGTERVA
jgi:hypothetical protein